MGKGVWSECGVHGEGGAGYGLRYMSKGVGCG